MTTLTSVIERIDSALTALEPLVMSARLNEDAAYQRLQTGKVKGELLEAKRAVASMTRRMASAARDVTFAAMPHRDYIQIDGGLGDPAPAKQGGIVLTFDAADKVRRFDWPVAAPADSEGGEY